MKKFTLLGAAAILSTSIATPVFRTSSYPGASSQGTGKTMNIHTIHSAKYPISRWALWKQDILMVSAFGIWATALGLLPVLVVGALIAN